jgi:periplasmic divalent cation tolerance protein
MDGARRRAALSPGIEKEPVMAAYIIFVTTPNRRTSEKIMRLTVDSKLAACANRVPGLISRYWWKGRVETAREELLVLKTEKRKIPALIRTVREAHPYVVCEVLAVKVAAGNPPYLDWIASSLKGR